MEHDASFFFFFFSMMKHGIKTWTSSTPTYKHLEGMILLINLKGLGGLSWALRWLLLDVLSFNKSKLT